jgi:pyrroline-5-carboxylate reductase
MELLIVGSGKMAEAIIAGTYKEYDISLLVRDVDKAKELSKKYEIKRIINLKEGFDISNADIVLAVKPHALNDVASYLKGEANSIISIMAGVTVDRIRSAIKSKYVVRAMPNLSATYQASMTTLFGDEEFKDQVIKICESFGKVLWLGNENEMDIATAVAGSGPAFLALVAEALSDGAVREGLGREKADLLVKGLFNGFSPLLEDIHPALIKDEVMSPGGTTAAGIASLEESGVRDAFIKVIKAAYDRAKEL